MSRALVLVDVDDDTGEVTFTRTKTRGGGVVEVVAEVTTDGDEVADGSTATASTPQSPGVVLRWLARLMVDA